MAPILPDSRPVNQDPHQNPKESSRCPFSRPVPSRILRLAPPALRCQATPAVWQVAAGTDRLPFRDVESGGQAGREILWERFSRRPLSTGEVSHGRGGNAAQANGSPGGRKHQPGRGHDRKSAPAKKKRFARMVAQKRRRQADDARKAWAEWDALPDDVKRLLGPAVEPKMPRPRDDEASTPPPP